jgi:two-component system sporulation sensor kinase A
VTHDDGYKIPVQISATTIILKGKKVMFGIFRDITDLKEIENALRYDRDSLETAVNTRTLELDKLSVQLQEASRLSEIGTLAAAVAHELRNPLGVIKTAVYNIRRKSKEGIIDKHIANIENKIIESEEIIEDLLTFAKITLPKFKKAPFIDILYDRLGHCKEKYRGYEVEVNVICNCEREKTLEADPMHMSELFSHILDNAYQSFPEKKGKIEVKVDYSEAEDRCCIKFSDNGMGIDKKDINEIFEPFFTRKPRGAGLGLTICNKIIELHNGKISVSSKEAEGTTFTVCMPINQKRSK